MKLIAITALSLTLAAVAARATEPHTDLSIPVSDERTRVREIAPGGSHRWTIRERATRLDAFALEAGRPRGLRMYLYDAEGNLKACDEDAKDGLGFGVRDTWQGPFTLVVKNVSREPNVYKLMVE
jgi:hypothetical protein